MTKRTIVILEITDDQPLRPWWEALGLPEPERWFYELPNTKDAHVKEILAKEVVR